LFSIPSLQKLLVLVAIIMAVWTVFKFVGQLDKSRRESGGAKRKSLWPWPARSQSSGRAGKPEARIEQTQKCPACGAYVPALKPSRCERADCPF
jgi:hypothetical protein